MRPVPRPSASEVRKRVRRSETLGLLLIALMIFLIVISRYGRLLHWSAR